jgi:hypothetical protein
VAPPERTVRSGTTSVLPPAPTVSSSRVRVNREVYVFFSCLVVVSLCINCKPVYRDMGGEKSDDEPANLTRYFILFSFSNSHVCIKCEPCPQGLGHGWGEE